MSKIYNRIIEERIKRWELENPTKTVVSEKKSYPVITISREFGARGAALAEYMAGKIVFKTWNREILTSVADKLGSDPEFLESLDESLMETVEDMVAGFMKNVYTNYTYIHTLKEVIRTIEEHGNAIIVGRGSNYICEDPSSFHVRVVEPLKKRVKGYADREGMSVEEARAMTETIDNERSEFIRHHFKRDVDDAADYDLVLNFGTFGLEDMMHIILEGYERKTGVKPNVLN